MAWELRIHKFSEREFLGCLKHGFGKDTNDVLGWFLRFPVAREYGLGMACSCCGCSMFRNLDNEMVFKHGKAYFWVFAEGKLASVLLV